MHLVSAPTTPSTAASSGFVPVTWVIYQMRHSLLSVTSRDVTQPCTQHQPSPPSNLKPSDMETHGIAMTWLG